MKSRLKRLLTGISFKEEYLCLADPLQQPLNVTLVTKNPSTHIDVSSTHLFLGYKPLIIAIPNSKLSEVPQDACLSLSNTPFVPNQQWKGFKVCSNSIANVLLVKVDSRRVGDSLVVFYKGVFGQHSFLSSINQLSNRWILKFKKKTVGNVDLPVNLYDQVRIAYAVPRKISIITIAEGKYMNMFPTDLHGKIGKEYYVSSLRIGGEACKQVELYGRIVVSDIESSRYLFAYSLGRNHMQPLRPKSDFELSSENSKLFNVPIPKDVCVYRELQVIETFDLGMHRIFIYRILNESKLKSAAPLHHIHNYYAQWREDNRMSTEYHTRVGNY